MAERVIVDMGFKDFEIYFKDIGKSAVISFNPNDTGIAIRFQEMEKRVESQLKDLQDIELNEKGEPKDLSFIENVKKINKVISNELDYAFGNTVSDKIFSVLDPLAVVKGEYYVVHFIRQFTPVLKKVIQKENKALEKHLADYRK